MSGAEKKSHTGVVRPAVSYAVVAVVSFILGVALFGSSESRVLANMPFFSDGLSAAPDESADMESFWKVWNTLDERFVLANASSSIPTKEEKLWAAIQGLASAYGDPYTVFMPPEEAKEFEESVSGKFEGVGMEIGVREGQLTVVAPLKGTPAERAGIQAGDIILSINGTDSASMRSDEAVNLIRGPRDTKVDLKLSRGGEVIEVSVTRAVIDVPVIEATHNTQTGIFSIDLYSFTGTSDRLFRNAIREFNKIGAKKLLIDLRGNPGGYLEAAVSIASHFLPKGALIVAEEYSGKKDNVEHRAYGPYDVPADTEVVILIDKGSASASEIVAGALQDHDVATIIGETSFGKGSVQQLVTIDKSSLKVTVARWTTPDGHWINGNGVTPDIQVERTAEDVRAERDPQKDRAIEFLTTGK